MIVGMKMLWKCLLSPRLYKIYRDGPADSMYQPHGGEKWGDKIINSANVILNITLYTSPFICLYIYKRGFFTYEESKYMAQFFGCIGCFLAFSFFVRAYGRATNPKYVEFLRALEGTGAVNHMRGVRKYDFDFSAWPVSFEMPSKVSTSWLPQNPFKTTANANLPLYQRVTIQLLAYIATHTFALRLIYPGSLGLIHNILWLPLFQGRTQLVEKYNGLRAKLKTADGNVIDTMYVDNRREDMNGATLVVCCEGNSGFYEVGIMISPIKVGFSVLGWNHPGFAGSSGLPYPSQEHNVIDAVMQYAINELNFKPENIVMFGWSIGGYSAAWASINYPVKALLLDATFDDLLPLAKNQMPASWSLLVKEVVRSYVNLNVAELLQQYSGPVHLVRRTEDEIICLKPGQYATNRGNNLLIEIVRQRHPNLFVYNLSPLIRYANMLDSKRPNIDDVHNDDERLVIKTVRRYMSDFRSTHCTPLQEDVFATCMATLILRNQ